MCLGLDANHVFLSSLQGLDNPHIRLKRSVQDPGKEAELSAGVQNYLPGGPGTHGVHKALLSWKGVWEPLSQNSLLSLLKIPLAPIVPTVGSSTVAFISYQSPKSKAHSKAGPWKTGMALPLGTAEACVEHTRRERACLAPSLKSFVICRIGLGHMKTRFKSSGCSRRLSCSLPRSGRWPWRSGGRWMWQMRPSASCRSADIWREITWIHSKGRGPIACQHHSSVWSTPSTLPPLHLSPQPARVGNGLCRWSQAGPSQP